MMGANKDLDMDDLYDLNEGSTSSHLEVLWTKYWGPVIEKYYKDFNLSDANKPLPPSIILALFKMFKYEIVTASSLKILSDIMQFVNPFLLNQMINFVSDKTSPLWVGISYAFLMFVASQTRSLMINHYFYLMYRIGTKIQTTLTSATFRKTLRLSNIARKDKTVGWAACVGALVMVPFVLLNYFSSVFVRKYQMAQMKCKDERVKLSNEILNGIKVIKLYAWEVPIGEMVEKIRGQELKYIKKCSLIKAFVDTFNQSSAFMVAFLTFLTFTLIDRDNNLLTPQIAFVSMVLMNLLRSPVMMLGLLINQVVQLSVSNQRLKEFLVCDEIKQDGVIKIVDKNDMKSGITIDNGQFSWDNLYDSKSNLCNINLNIDKGQLVAVIGKVGSGKSSLLQAMLGEMPQMDGESTVTMNGTIAYAPQQPWILNLSIRENILFGSPYNAKAYQKVLKASTLDKDIPNFPNGDLTEIGEKGVSLSGGQRARIGLAVACYSNNDIVLLDDPLAAVDSHVGKHIFENVIGREGLLKNKTRILVTNNTLLLDKVDLIIMMEDSQIKRCGTYQNLINDPFFSAFMRDVEKDRGSESSSSIENVSEELDFDNISTLSDFDERDQLKTALFTSKEIDISSGIDKELAGAIMTEELLETGSVKMDVYMTYFKATSYFLAGFFMMGYLFENLLSMSRSLWLSGWSDSYEKIANNETHSNITLETRLAVFGSIGGLESVAFICSMVALIHGGLAASKNLHYPLFNNILHLPMSFFDTTPLGRILQRFGKDIDVIDTTLPLSFRYFMMCVCQVVVALGLIVSTTPAFAIVIIPLGFVYWRILQSFVPSQRQLQRIQAIAKSPIYSHFKETIEGASNIRAYGKSDSFIHISDKRIDTLIKVKYLSNAANRWLSLRLEFIGSCVIFFAVMFGAISKEMEWIKSTGLIAVSITYSLSITDVLMFAIRCIAQLETDIVSVERVSEYSTIQNEPEWRNEKGKALTNWPSKGEIKFENYSTRYREGLDLVIKNLTVTIKGGEKVGLVGRTGSGKSSLTLGLFQMIEAAEGRILIDDVDISEIGLHDLRSNITIVPQDPVLFSSADLSFNLSPFNEHTDAQIWQALEHSHMKEFVVNKLENGLQTIVTEGGSNFSQGQKQLLCLTRALLRRSRIIVLDEMSSSIDQQTDQLIQETIRKEFADSTIIAIAHRIDTLLNYDRIMVMDQGNVIEFDTPANLLSNRQSVFYSLALDAGLVRDS
uniref:ABC transporter family protein n=1 Tax=Rhabditophanes sp. KR3021 TaxID=114890 RepID=A0AC35TPP3_9BILA